LTLFQFERRNAPAKSTSSVWSSRQRLSWSRLYCVKLQYKAAAGVNNHVGAAITGRTGAP